MSASREKKTRQGSTYAQRRNNKAEEKSSRMHVVYGVVGVVIAILAVIAIIYLLVRKNPYDEEHLHSVSAVRASGN